MTLKEATKKFVTCCCYHDGTSSDYTPFYASQEQRNLNTLNNENDKMVQINLKNLEFLLTHYDIDVNQTFSSNDDMKMLFFCSTENKDRFSTDCTPLTFACEKGYLLVVRKLLESPKTDINKVDKNGLTALATAYRNERIDIARELLQHEDIDVNVGQCLGMVCAHCDVDTLKEFLQRSDIRFEVVNAGGRNIFFGVTHADKYKELLPFATEETINKRDNFGMTPLDYACSMRSEDSVELLLTHPKTKDIIHVSDKVIQRENKRGYPKIIALFASYSASRPTK
ncbi:MAG: ankyrin repeat domain-containing protein [Bdellovibrionota bacterium]